MISDWGNSTLVGLKEDCLEWTQGSEDSLPAGSHSRIKRAQSKMFACSGHEKVPKGWILRCFSGVPYIWVWYILYTNELGIWKKNIFGEN